MPSITPNYMDNDYRNGSICYIKYPPKPIEGSLTFNLAAYKTAVFVTNVIFYPLLFVGTVIYSIYQISTALHARWDQSKLVTLMNDDVALGKYAENKKQANEQDCKHLQELALKIFEDQPNAFKKFMGLPEQKSFSEEELDVFLATPYDPHYENTDPKLVRNYQTLQAYRLTIQKLIKQKEILDPDSYLSSIKTVAAFHFIHLKLVQERALCSLKHYAWLLLPCGSYKISERDDRDAFSRKKVNLTDMECLKEFKRIRKAHNELLVKHDFLIPFFDNEVLSLSTNVN